MRNLLLILLVLSLSFYSVGQDTEYKFNSRTGKFDMVRTTSWLLNNLPDSISALSGDVGYIPYFQTANKIVSSPLYFNGVNVGLGKTNPSYKLDINGSINSPYYLLNGASLKKSIDTVSTSLSTGLLKVTTGTGKLTTAVAGTDYQTPLINPVTGIGTVNSIPVWSSGSSVGSSIIQTDGTRVSVGVAPSTYTLRIQGTAYASSYFFSPTITSSGSVNSNNYSTYSVVESLSIFPQSNVSTCIRFGVGNNNTVFTTEWARFQSGNLGVGTTNPNYKLDVNGSINALYYLLNGVSFKKSIDTVSTSMTTGLLKVTNGTGKLSTAVSGTDYQTPLTAGIDYQTPIVNPVTGSGTVNYIPVWATGSNVSNSIIQSDGTNVGIGMSPATYKLRVNGAIASTTNIYADKLLANSFSTQSSSGTSIDIYPQSTTSPYIRFGIGNNNTVFTTEWARFQAGNLGVGVTNPTYKLDVSGAINATGGIYINGVRKDTNWDSASGVSDGDKGDVIVSSSGSVWEVDAGTVVKLSGNQTIAGTKTFSSTISGSISGSAGQVANTLTRGSYLTGNDFNGSAATTWAVDATSANTASKVVARDASGNFSAGAIIADTRLESKSFVSPYREVVLSAGTANIDCSLGTEVYIGTNGIFTVNISNVRNGSGGDILVNSSATFSVTLGACTTIDSNTLTKKSSGVFSSLAAGLYYITWNAVDLGSGKRFISFNIGLYN